MKGDFGGGLENAHYCYGGEAGVREDVQDQFGNEDGADAASDIGVARGVGFVGWGGIGVRQGWRGWGWRRRRWWWSDLLLAPAKVPRNCQIWRSDGEHGRGIAILGDSVAAYSDPVA